jgi:hypothetical protein
MKPRLHTHAKQWRKFPALIAVIVVICAVMLVTNVTNVRVIITKASSPWIQQKESNEPSLVDILVAKHHDDYPKPANYEWKLQLYTRLDQVKQKCGVLCTLNSPERFIPYQVVVPGWDHWEMIHIPGWDDAMIHRHHRTFNGVTSSQCSSFIAMEELDASDSSFPEEIPQELISIYSLNNSIDIQPHTRFFRQEYLDSRTITWTQRMIDEMIDQANAGTLTSSYGLAASHSLRRLLEQLPMQDARVLVIGTENPWVEAIALSLGAAHVVTLEYSTIISMHPRLSAVTPSMFRKQFMDNTLQLFDVILTHSSIEHSGLGRYGDALNPWGDILAIARAWCVTKPHGFLYLGVPTGVDGIQYNGQRIYGKVRWPLISVNWRPLVPGTAIQVESASTHVSDRRANITIISDGEELKRSTPASGSDGGHGYLFQKVSS